MRGVAAATARTGASLIDHDLVRRKHGNSVVRIILQGPFYGLGQLYPRQRDRRHPRSRRWLRRRDPRLQLQADGGTAGRSDLIVQGEASRRSCSTSPRPPRHVLGECAAQIPGSGAVRAVLATGAWGWMKLSFVRHELV